MVDEFEFKEVESIPTLERNRIRQYENILRKFDESDKSMVELYWKGRASLETVAVSLRKAVKDFSFKNKITVTSRSRKEGNKRVTYAIYLSKNPKTEEPERKKKAK